MPKEKKKANLKGWNASSEDMDILIQSGKKKAKTFIWAEFYKELA